MEPDLEQLEVIVGPHSIIHAINNPNRGYKKLFTTNETYSELQKLYGKKFEFKTDIFKAHKLQEVAKEKIEALGFTYRRIPGNAFLLTSKLPEVDNLEIYNQIEKNDEYRIVVLDQVTDVHNAAAIMRSAAFYNIDLLVVPGKNSFRVGPSFTRIASGAYEHCQILTVASMAKFLAKIKDKGVSLVGFSEHAKQYCLETTPRKVALVLGAEDKGLSNATSRLVDELICLKSSGQIHSLNVSVATTVALERVLNPLKNT
ncbi:MAG: TrmH family RNA methyltransferase [Bacteriovoracaceae bacterium]